MAQGNLAQSPDSHEIDALESLEISDGYQLLVARVLQVIEDKRNSLERSGDKADEHRGFLAACRMFLELPAQLRNEIQSQMKEK